MIIIFNPTTGARAELEKLAQPTPGLGHWAWRVSYQGRTVAESRSDTSERDMADALNAATSAAAEWTDSARAQDAIRALVAEL